MVDPFVVDPFVGVVAPSLPALVSAIVLALSCSVATSSSQGPRGAENDARLVQGLLKVSDSCSFLREATPMLQEGYDSKSMP